MVSAEEIKNKLSAKFPFLENKIVIPRPRRIFVEVDLSQFEEIFVFAKNELKFNHLVTITGFDDPETLSFMYHLAHDNGVLLNIKIRVSKKYPHIKTVTAHFPNADAYERELEDLLGAKVEGLAPGNRYPLTDDWPNNQFPLRKDWKPDSLAGGKTDGPNENV
jgi:membrane-bound hydrogenase subunit beta